MAEKADWGYKACRRLSFHPAADDLRPTQRPYFNTEDDLTERKSKPCSKCKLTLPVGRFAKRPDRAVGLQSQCRECISAARRAGYAQRARHGMTREEREALLASQRGDCPVCNLPIPNDDRGWQIGAVDHDHECCPGAESCGKCVRGILCKNCNFAIGLMGDSPSRMRSAAAYLEGFGS